MTTSAVLKTLAVLFGVPLVVEIGIAVLGMILA
jgi:hypothetical protein